jgi:hypothetical protein
MRVAILATAILYPAAAVAHTIPSFFFRRESAPVPGPSSSGTGTGGGSGSVSGNHPVAPNNS